MYDKKQVSYKTVNSGCVSLCFGGARDVTVMVMKMESAIRVQILGVTVCISHSYDTHKKSMDLNVFIP